MAERPFDERGLASTPIEQFQLWFADAVAAGQPEPEAMAVATATPQGEPSLRWVLLRGVDERGFVFYTDARSSKAADLAANPVAAAGFRWWTVGRQVRVRGSVQPVEAAESDAYYAGRPRGAQIGAWASTQSAVLPSRADLEERVAEVAARFAGDDVPRPPWWGGYRIRPAEIEFWQNRADRLHDRLRFSLRDGGWRVERLSP